jgi:flagellar biogenesis protein FliO
LAGAAFAHCDAPGASVGSDAVTSPLGVYVAETIVALVAIVALAVLLLYGARRLGVGRPLGPLELLGRLPLEPRRSIYLVRVADRVLIVGASEAGLTRLGQLPHSAGLTADPVRSLPRFTEILRAALGRPVAVPEPNSAEPPLGAAGETSAQPAANPPKTGAP